MKDSAAIGMRGLSPQRWAVAFRLADPPPSQISCHPARTASSPRTSYSCQPRVRGMPSRTAPSGRPLQTPTVSPRQVHVGMAALPAKKAASCAWSASAICAANAGKLLGSLPGVVPTSGTGERLTVGTGGGVEVEAAVSRVGATVVGITSGCPVPAQARPRISGTDRAARRRTLAPMFPPDTDSRMALNNRATKRSRLYSISPIRPHRPHPSSACNPSWKRKSRSRAIWYASGRSGFRIIPVHHENNVRVGTKGMRGAGGVLE